VIERIVAPLVFGSTPRHLGWTRDFRTALECRPDCLEPLSCGCPIHPDGGLAPTPGRSSRKHGRNRCDTSQGSSRLLQDAPMGAGLHRVLDTRPRRYVSYTPRARAPCLLGSSGWLRLRFCLVVPVEARLVQLRPSLNVEDLADPFVRRPGLHETHGDGGVLGKPSRHDRPGGAATEHDVVERCIHSGESIAHARVMGRGSSQLLFALSDLGHAPEGLMRRAGVADPGNWAHREPAPHGVPAITRPQRVDHGPSPALREAGIGPHHERILAPMAGEARSVRSSSQSMRSSAKARVLWFPQ